MVQQSMNEALRFMRCHKRRTLRSADGQRAFVTHWASSITYIGMENALGDRYESGTSDIQGSAEGFGP